MSIEKIIWLIEIAITIPLLFWTAVLMYKYHVKYKPMAVNLVLEGSTVAFYSRAFFLFACIRAVRLVAFPDIANNPAWSCFWWDVLVVMVAGLIRRVYLAPPKNGK